MKKVSIIVGILVTIGLGWVLVRGTGSTPEEPKYIYAVREKIDYQPDRQSFEVWCNHEFADGHIDRTYLYSMTLYGKNINIDRVKTSLCEQTDNLN